jgi:hypothetical protein
MARLANPPAHPVLQQAALRLFERLRAADIAVLLAWLPQQLMMISLR